MVLFGRPSKLTAFALNSRNIGNLDIDDSVSYNLFGVPPSNLPQFTIMLHYEPGPNRPIPLTAILRGSILSVRSQQLRYVLRGTKGTFEKHGVDVQEDQLKAIADPTFVHEQGYGQEPENMWGTVENLAPDGKISFNRFVHVQCSSDIYSTAFPGGLQQILQHMCTYSPTLQKPFKQANHWL